MITLIIEHELKYVLHLTEYLSSNISNARIF